MQTRWGFYARKLAAMSWEERRARGAQELAKRIDLLRYWLGIAPKVREVEGAAAARFFFTREEIPVLTGILHSRFPGEVEQVLGQAERICEHRFDLLGYEGLSYGQKIDWHLDAVHGKSAPRRPWFQVRFLEFAEVGDHKVIWELNRHQHLVTLAKAYRLSGDERFLVELLAQWYDWQRENPYPLGVNWASTLEVAFRSLSWLWVRYLLEGCAAVPERFWRDLRDTLGTHGRYIERYLSTYFAPNTHLLGEGVALFFIGLLEPGFSTAGRWRETGWAIVLEQAGRQVRSDGLHFEQSIYYHVYALDFFLHARILAARNGMPVPAAFDRTLEKMLVALEALSQAGVLPRFGDDDGGRLFHPRRNRSEHMLDPLSTGAALYGRADFRCAAGDLREETVWLLGEDGVARFDGLVADARRQRSVGFESSGIYAMSGLPAGPQQLFVDAGAQGFGAAGHGHADALSVQLAGNGRMWLIDPGAFRYIAPGTERNRFRGTAAHNTLQVDGLDQAAPLRPFTWGPLPEVTVDRWINGETFDYFAGHHTGYLRLPQPVLHQRQIFGLKGQFWLVRDCAIGEGTHQLDLRWHLAPDSPEWAILSPAGHGWSQETEEGEWSPVYGRAEASPVLHFYTETVLPAEFAVALIPLQGAERQDVSLKVIEGTGVHGYRYESPQGIHQVFFGQGGSAWKSGEWASDAELLYCGPGARGEQHVILCHGSYAETGGRRVASCPEIVRQYESNPLHAPG